MMTSGISSIHLPRRLTLPKPFVSVIINCFNGEPFLKESIESVLEQSYQDWELIIWDNQSTDRTPAIVSSYDDGRIRYFRAESFEPLGRARNLAADHARGEWIAFLDCDDLWKSDKLSLQIAEVSACSSELGLVYSPAELLMSSSSDTAMVAYYQGMLSTVSPHYEISIFHRLLFGNFIIFSSLLLRADLFFSVGGIDPSLKQNEDLDLLLKVSRKATAVCISTISTTYRIHSANVSTENGFLHYEEMEKILKALPQEKIVEKAISANFIKKNIYDIFNGELLRGIQTILISGNMKSLYGVLAHGVYRRLKHR